MGYRITDLPAETELDIRPGSVNQDAEGLITMSFNGMTDTLNAEQAEALGDALCRAATYARAMAK